MENREKIALALGGFCPNGRKHVYTRTNVEHIEGDWFKVTGKCIGCGIKWMGKIRVINFEIEQIG